jgi:hypothetical protein
VIAVELADRLASGHRALEPDDSQEPRIVPSRTGLASTLPDHAARSPSTPVSAARRGYLPPAIQGLSHARAAERRPGPRLGMSASARGVENRDGSAIGLAHAYFGAQ